MIIFSGCGVSSRIILLEDTKTNSALTVKTQAGEEVLKSPNTYSELSSQTAKPGTAKQLSQEEIDKQFGALIQQSPKKPTSFLLYFHSGGTALTNESTKLFTLIEEAIKERVPCEVNIIGHADTEGSSKHNITISLSRAKHVHELLLAKKLDIVTINVESYGEKDLLIPTKDGVSEPKNRRVELLIR